uniref:Uncharacterized protein n=1 Tax=Siphoviridae sp. cttDR14 TaxID=2826490 RepID=A0A8S5M2L4_9CAUD|nr:MAG TPA: hypothetical protein [Siphoviridae sp. cttDR14]
MNKFKVTINDIDYTSHAIYPLKWGELLDERLDEAYFTLKFIDKAEPFQPLDKVSISINDGTKIVNYYVANDKVDNNPVGSNLYTHTLYVIEETKFLEAFICDTLTFRNALLAREGTQAQYDATKLGIDGWTLPKASLSFKPKNPQMVGADLILPTLSSVFSDILHGGAGDLTQISVLVAGYDNKTTEIIVDKDGEIERITDFNKSETITLGITTTIIYHLVVKHTVPGNPSDVTYYYLGFEYIINGVENRLPLKKWTITDVVNRCLELAEPLREGENPRFHFDGVKYQNGEAGWGVGEIFVSGMYKSDSQAEKYDKIIAPEFSMTKNTLREQLKQIGGFIHAEPRLSGNTITFVEWGGNEQSKISEKQFISQSQTHSIDEYCTELDSTANNLVNRLNYAQGVVMEPHTRGAKSLRTEQKNIRIEETNGIIETVLPIADLVKLEVSAPKNEGATEYSSFTDITSFTYEQSDYSNLSSYDSNSRGTKAYALYWARNQKNIKGLFFKNENALNPIYSKYAIVNILSARNVDMNTGTDNSNYPLLRFRVSYIPIYTARVRTNKSLVVDTLPRTLVYNQGANSVETQYYGENLKGVAARLGNIEKIFTYKLTTLSDVPKAGELFDDHYYISAVSCELYPDYIKCTIGLSKDFNRLSEYIGISSEYRQYQVSETAVYNRETVVQEYALITFGTEETTDDNLFLITSINSLPTALWLIEGLFKGFSPYGKVSCAEAIPRNKSGASLLKQNEKICLPVVSSSFGNAISFRFAFDDNYSAGQKSVVFTEDDKTQYYSEYVPYTDYYGKFYWLDFAFKNDLGFVGYGASTEPLSLPSEFSKGDYDYTYIKGKLRYRKDNAEIPALNYQLSFVTDSQNIIIGSALASECYLVNDDHPIYKIESKPLKVYGFYHRLPLFSDKLDITDDNAKELGTIESSITDKAITFATIKKIPNAIKAWAMVTQSDETSQTVEDESGNETTQTVQNGYRLVIGCNKDYAAGDDIVFPRIVFKHKIYK